MITASVSFHQFARVAAAAGLLSGAATAGHAAAPAIAAGQYSAFEQVTALKATGGATAKDCATAYGTAGTHYNAILTVSVASASAYTFDVRYTAGPPPLGIVRQSLKPSASSSLLKQSGILTAYYDGQVQAAFPYSATLEIVDGSSFLAQIVAQAPSPTGTGTCVQSLDATFVLTGAS